MFHNFVVFTVFLIKMNATLSIRDFFYVCQPTCLWNKLWQAYCLYFCTVDVTEQCPERILGNERRQTCPKKCQQDKDCGNKRQCLCDGQCGLSCVAPGQSKKSH